MTLRKWRKKEKKTSTDLKKETKPKREVPTREQRTKSECKVKHLLERTIRSHITNTTSA